MGIEDHRAQVRDFLSSRRARLTPERAGLASYGGNRRVAGLRREEVAMLAGVSIDYYVRMERGNLAGASEGVLEALSAALQLDEAEREHLFALARTAGPGRNRPRPKTGAVRPVILTMLEAIVGAPAWVRNGRHDILAMNALGAALYSPILSSPVAGPTPRRPANTARYIYLDPTASDFFVDYQTILSDSAAMLRLEAGRNPHDPELVELIGELSTCSEIFRQRWASNDVRLHRSGTKRLRHPAVGRLDLSFESMTLQSDPGLQLNIYVATTGTGDADALRLLASWAATQDLPIPAPQPGR